MPWGFAPGLSDKSTIEFSVHRECGFQEFNSGADYLGEGNLHAVSFAPKEGQIFDLEKQNGNFVSDDLREREDNIIWRVR